MPRPRLLGAASAAVLAIVCSAQAQDASVETVVVTGSLVRSTTFDTASPLTVLSKDKIDMSGLTSTADVIRSLAADGSGSIPSSWASGFAAGSSGVSLRGLTVSSTLVLINNRRTANYALADDGERTFVDLNTIPFGVVKEIQVLKDGASSMYGADAIGGVVNIIMEDEFQGVKATAEAGTSEHGGGDMRHLEGTVGWGSLSKDKYNLYIHGEYEENNAISLRDRPFPFNTLDLRSIGGINNNGSSSIYGRAIPTYMADQANPVTGGSAIGASRVLATGGCGPLTTINFGTYCQQDAALYGEAQPRMRQFAAYAHAGFNFSEAAQGYLDFSFSGADTWSKSAPRTARSGSPKNTNNIALPAYLADGTLNPNNPFAVAGCAGANNPNNPDPLHPNAGTERCIDAIPYYRFGDITRLDTSQNRVLRVSAGFKGTYLGWGYDVGFVAAHTELEGVNRGYISYNGLVNVIENGTYNFRDPSKNTEAVRDLVSPVDKKSSTTDMQSIDIRVNREVFDLPGGPVQIGLGAELRHEGATNPDANPDLDYIGIGVAHYSGSRNIYSMNGEVLMPLFKNTVAGSAEVDVSGRFDHYSDFGDSWVPKVTAQWQIVPQLKLRGTWSQGFRAPSFAENGESAATGYVTIDPASYSPAWVAKHPGSEYALPMGGFAEETLGNKHIKPETSRSFTAGAVISPLDDIDLRFSVDYYNIKKKNVIQMPPDFDTAIQAAFDGTPIPAGVTVTFDNPDPMFPSAPRRPIKVSATYVNAAWLETEGLDLALQAGFSVTDDLHYSTSIEASQTMKFAVKTPDRIDQYVGTQSPYNLSSGAGTPRWRTSWAQTITYDQTSLTGTFNLVSGEKEIGYDAGTGCLYTGTPNTPAGDCKFGDFWTMDLNIQHQLNDRIKLYGTIRNAFDRLPPVAPSNYAGVNWNPTYHQSGIVGRFFSVGITFQQ